jgi:hypothetical protein
VNGELSTDGDQWRLRFARRLPHASEKVWRALTEDEHLRTWFPQRVSGQVREAVSTDSSQTLLLTAIRAHPTAHRPEKSGPQIN